MRCAFFDCLRVGLNVHLRFRDAHLEHGNCGSCQCAAMAGEIGQIYLLITLRFCFRTITACNGRSSCSLGEQGLWRDPLLVVLISAMDRVVALEKITWDGISEMTSSARYQDTNRLANDI